MLLFVLLTLFHIVNCGDTEHRSNYNRPNPDLPGLSEHGQKVEKKLYNRVVNKTQGWHEVGKTRVENLRWEMASAQEARNIAKNNELRVKKELNKKGRDLNSIKSRLRANLHPLSSEFEHRYHVNRKENQKEKIRNIVSDAAIHKAHGNFNEDDVTRVVRYPWRGSNDLGYDNDARITSASGYKSLSPSPIRSSTPSHSQSASPKRSS